MQPTCSGVFVQLHCCLSDTLQFRGFGTATRCNGCGKQPTQLLVVDGTTASNILASAAYCISIMSGAACRCSVSACSRPTNFHVVCGMQLTRLLVVDGTTANNILASTAYCISIMSGTAIRCTVSACSRPTHFHVVYGMQLTQLLVVYGTTASFTLASASALCLSCCSLALQSGAPSVHAAHTLTCCLCHFSQEQASFSSTGFFGTAIRCTVSACSSELCESRTYLLSQT